MPKNLWQSFLDLFRSPRAPYVPSPDPFLQLDVEALRRELQPAARGGHYGEQNLPPTDAVAPDGREHEIRRRLQEELNRAHRQVTTGIDTHLASIRQLSGNAAESEIAQYRSTGSSELQSVAQQSRNELEGSLQHATELTKAFERFRITNKRTAPPDISKSSLLSYAVLAVMVAVESAANGNLFAQGSDFGLLGGVFIACLFSFVNVGLGVLTGIVVIRQLFHVSTWRRSLGAIGGVLAFVVAVALNFGVAHYRDALTSAQPGDPSKIALTEFVNHTFHLDNMFSSILFGLGFIFFWIACYEGFQFDDPYPTYGARYRALLWANDHYVNLVNHTHRLLAAIRDKYVKLISDVVKQRDVYVHHQTSLYDRIERLTGAYQTHSDSVRSVYRLLIEEYRDANRLKRSTPPPSYFSHLDDLTPKPVPSYTPPEPADDLAGKAVAAISALTDYHDEIIRSLPTISELGTTPDAKQQSVA